MHRPYRSAVALTVGLGCGVEATWSRLLKGESGARRIEKFEVSDLQGESLIERGLATRVKAAAKPANKKAAEAANKGA